MKRTIGFILSCLLSFPAYAPVAEWRLVPVGWTEVNLCQHECELKAYFVTDYRWIP